jgi:hypothetical protein
MKFPRKFRRLLETRLADVERPNHVAVVYAVCAVRDTSCGWGGWILDGAFRRPRRRSKTWPHGRPLPSTGGKCPRCGKVLFRTDAQLLAEVKGPFPPHPFDSDVVPMEFSR